MEMSYQPLKMQPDLRAAMARRNISPEAEFSAELFRDYEPLHTQWMREVNQDRNYFYNKQWTIEQAVELMRRGQAPLVINRITPVVLNKLAQLLLHAPTIRAFPIEKSDNKKSWMWSMVIENVLQTNEFRMVDLQVKRDHLIDGVGFYHTCINPYGDYGRGEIVVERLSADDVYIDPNSTKLDFSDASFILVSKVMSIAQALQVYPDKEEAIWAAEGQMVDANLYENGNQYSDEGVILREEIQGMFHSSASDKEGHYVRIIERYERIQVPMYIVVNRVLGIYHVVSEEEYKTSFEDAPHWSATKMYRPRIAKVITAGETELISEEVLPIDIFPIVGVQNLWTNTPYPLGDVRFLRGPQDEVNKRRSLMILNATSANTSKWIHEEGAVDDQLWDRLSARPGARLPYKLGFQPPQQILPGQIPTALMALEETAKHDMEYIAGTFSLSQGDPTGAPQTYSATLAIEEFGSRRIQTSLQAFSIAKTKLGKLIIKYAQEWYQAPKLIRITGDGQKVQELVLNEPAMTPGGTPFVKNEVDDFEYDVIVETGKFTPTNRMAYTQLMMDLFDRRIVDNTAVLEALDIADREELIARIGREAELMNNIEAMSDEIKKLQGDLQTAERTAIMAGIQKSKGEYDNLEEAELLDTKYRERINRAKMDADTRNHRQELRLMLRERELEEREKALKEQSRPTPAK